MAVSDWAMTVTTFCLIHGGFGDGATWAYLAKELRERDFEGVAPDLPNHDSGASLLDHAATVESALRQSGSDVVVVAHSGGGLVLPLVANLRPVRKLIGLSAILPVPGLAWVNDEMPPMEASDAALPRLVYRVDGGQSVMDPDAAVQRFFHDVPADVCEYAIQHLKPQSSAVFEEPSPMVNWPDVATAYIVCGADRSLAPSWQRMMSRQRAGVEPVEMSAVGHSPFYSRPGPLAALLETMVRERV